MRKAFVQDNVKIEVTAMIPREKHITLVLTLTNSYNSLACFNLFFNQKTNASLIKFSNIRTRRDERKFELREQML